MSTLHLVSYLQPCILGGLHPSLCLSQAPVGALRHRTFRYLQFVLNVMEPGFQFAEGNWKDMRASITQLNKKSLRIISFKAFSAFLMAFPTEPIVLIKFAHFSK